MIYFIYRDYIQYILSLYGYAVYTVMIQAADLVSEAVFRGEHHRLGGRRLQDGQHALRIYRKDVQYIPK